MIMDLMIEKSNSTFKIDPNNSFLSDSPSLFMIIIIIIISSIFVFIIIFVFIFSLYFFKKFYKMYLQFIEFSSILFRILSLAKIKMPNSEFLNSDPFINRDEILNQDVEVERTNPFINKESRNKKFNFFIKKQKKEYLEMSNMDKLNKGTGVDANIIRSKEEESAFAGTGARPKKTSAIMDPLNQEEAVKEINDMQNFPDFDPFPLLPVEDSNF